MIEKLARGLQNLAAQRYAVQTPERCCSFCGRGQDNLFLGPKAQICVECSQIACGMFIAAWRDNLSFAVDYKRIFDAACTDYFRREGEVPHVTFPHGRVA